jgi:hypothetical protein
VIRASTTSVGLIGGIDGSPSQVRLLVGGVGDPLSPTIRMPGEPKLIGQAVTVGWFALRKPLPNQAQLGCLQVARGVARLPDGAPRRPAKYSPPH